ncbi:MULTISPECIES: pyridoxal phosphate-dependent aminotransferase [Pseudomonas]|jgi:aspartate aminotransferase|uniref:Aminotransferase n=1 Tax=Pseudomonas sp. WC2401 TaxID=3234143 RepID=A0AB39WVG9_9PSED|nr:MULTISPECIES: pyridoxal phosphate-dependent aminotransferase [Pseudomonas]MDY7580724.1 pyridoxal phosphate-dependent aminotransferase [Pseudomonas sp. CCI3.1]MEB0067222.1 pyridoxal phosphate-dependent aminotransferase [Pseudomonas sp. CCI3.1]MEB0073995.1 pyridoxal phosphate-dependent aminotransferase [Pseudomonas sp. CCI1.4]NMY55388.1 pyridoxal phosphate-dependent aminotransferase [Pseudomonas sp. WS 5051]WRT58710.1 pyridoxal phosphate-dependent aminotransferase [Pseudomonas fragi]
MHNNETPTSAFQSPILLMAKLAATMRAEGRDVIDLTLGEPDFNAPEHVLDAAHLALGSRLTYSPSNGIEPLRSAIRMRVREDRGLDFGDDQIAVGCGAKQIIFNAFQATLKPGDDVIVPAPYWASYPAMIKMCGAQPIILPTTASEGFRLTAEHLAAGLRLAKSPKWVILNAPGNPSGSLYSETDLQALAEVLRQYPDVMVLSDDIYAEIRFTQGPCLTLASVAPDLAERILIVDGVSKAYAMTGWRVGWGCGSRSLISAITTVQSQNCTQTSTLSQLAAVAALEGPRGFLAERNAIYRQRRDAALQVLQASDKLEVSCPEGAFYLLPQFKTSIDDQSLALDLLEVGVATVPGSAFGLPGHLRLSFATDEATLVEGCKRLVRALEAYS